MAKADPWSVMKVSFLLSIALGVCTVVAAAVLWMVMDAMGVFSTVGGTISEATGSNESNGFDLQSFLSLPRVLLFTSVIAVIDVVLATALSTLGAFIYNLSAGFVGGVEPHARRGRVSSGYRFWGWPRSALIFGGSAGL